MSTPAVFDFIDYRKFLAEYYRSKKETSRYFSYRYFSQKLGFNSPSFLKAVIEGKRNLTRPMLERFCKAMNFGMEETLYFKNLVFFNQAKTSAEKQEYYLSIKSMAGEALDSVDKNERHSSSITMSISPETYELIASEINAFKDRVKAIANSDGNGGRIYQMTVSLLPASGDVRSIDGGKGKKAHL
jgi:hypothetical protein